MLQCVRAFAVLYWALAGGSDSKEHADKAGDPGLIPGSGRSPEEEHTKDQTKN